MDGLTDECSIVLCDSNARGFPILHASRGFEELFGYKKEEYAGLNCGELIGSQCILSSCQTLLDAAAAAGLDAAAAVQGIQRLKEQAAQTVRKAHKQQEQIVGPVLLINRKKHGDLFVCEMSLQFTRHPLLGWPYAVAIQQDISNQLSVASLLKAAAADYVDVSALDAPDALKTVEHLGRRETVEHVHFTMGLVWQDILNRDLAQKKLSADKKCRGPRSATGQSLASVSTACTLSERRTGCTSAVSEPPQLAAFATYGSLQQEACAPFHHLGAFVEMRTPAGKEHRERFLDMLEVWSTSSCSSEALSAASSDFGEERANFQNQITELLYPLHFPLIIADPSEVDVPIMLCSRGLIVMTDCHYPAILGQSLPSVLQRSPCTTTAAEEEEIQAFLTAARQHRFYEGSSAPGRPGELLTRCILGEEERPTNCAVLLKQFILSDRMLVMAMMERLSCDADSGTSARTLWKLIENIETATRVMAARFFFSASLQRQQA